MCFSVQIDIETFKASSRLGARRDEKAFSNFSSIQALENNLSPEELKAALGLKRKPKSQVFKTPGDDHWHHIQDVILLLGSGRCSWKNRHTCLDPDEWDSNQ